MRYEELGWVAGDGVALFARHWQPAGEAVGVVCLVHGIGEHSGRYPHVAAVLTDAGYAVLAADTRGHGRSAGPRGHFPSYDAVMDDIALLLEQGASRYPGQPCFLYGHSLGGNLVLTYLLRRRPVLNGAIATSPLILPAFDPPAWKLAAGQVVYRVRPGMVFSNEIDTSGLSHDPAVGAAYLADPLNHNKVSARLGVDMLEAGRQILAQAGQFPPVPLLLVHGTGDQITSHTATEQFAARVPGEVTLKLWDGLAHETHNEPAKDEVIAFLVDWLKEHTP